MTKPTLEQSDSNVISIIYNIAVFFTTQHGLLFLSQAVMDVYSDFYDICLNPKQGEDPTRGNRHYQYYW